MPETSITRSIYVWTAANRVHTLLWEGERNDSLDGGREFACAEFDSCS